MTVREVTGYIYASNHEAISMTIRERVQYVCMIAFKFDHLKYLTDSGKQLVVFKINTLERRYQLLEGDVSNDVLEAANKKYFDSKAGYLVDLKSQLPTPLHDDLLSLSDIVLYSNPADLDTIILHELVHCLIESGNAGAITEFGEWEILAKNTFALTDKHNQFMTRHTMAFCDLLAIGCSRYNATTANFRGDWDSIRSAMRFDLFIDEQDGPKPKESTDLS